MRKKYPGKFIVFEGLDGSGQSTQAGKLVEFLKQQSLKNKFGHTGAHLTKEPTPGLIGGLIRCQLTHDWKSSQTCLQLLFAADRAHHLEKEVIPLLEKGVVVVCDRYYFTSLVYGLSNIKDANDIKDEKWLWDVNRNFLYPDIIFLLNTSPKTCIDRIQKTRYSVELFEKKELLTKIWKRYKKLPNNFKNICIINGEQQIEKVFEDIKKIIDQKLARV